jgi:hypothetical protein
MKTDTFPYFPLEVTEDEAAVGFRPMVLALGTISCIPSDACKVVARRLSESDVAIKWKGTNAGGGEHISYEHLRYGYRVPRVLRFLPKSWTKKKSEWNHLGWSRDPSKSPSSPYKYASEYIGVPFTEAQQGGGEVRS